MSKRIKVENYNEGLKYKEEMIILGYVVDEKTPFHWRVSREDSDVQVDIWASSRKYWVVGSQSPAETYEKLTDIIKLF